MGRLEHGQWIVEDLISKSPTGEFKRPEQSFRDRITPYGPYIPEKNRYHLYVSYACPWAHRAIIMRKLKGLEQIISMSVVSPYMLDQGWTFKSDFNAVVGDPVFDKMFLKDVYTAVEPNFTGRVTVPVLLDKKSKKIVNSESSEVIRILNEAFNEMTGNQEDYYPQQYRADIDTLNQEIYDNVNNGVYKAGFATTQEAYEKSVKNVFKTLDHVDERLQGKNFLMGSRLTEADIRLYTTLIRFDPVYYVHFKCNRTMIRDFKNLSRYLRNLYEIDAFKSTTHFDHIKTHYYYSQKQINPYQIIPWGPDPLFPG